MEKSFISKIMVDQDNIVSLVREQLTADIEQNERRMREIQVELNIIGIMVQVKESPFIEEVRKYFADAYRVNMKTAMDILVGDSKPYAKKSKYVQPRNKSTQRIISCINRRFEGNGIIRSEEIKLIAEQEKLDMRTDIIDLYSTRVCMIIDNGSYVVKATDADLELILEVCRGKLKSEQYFRMTSNKYYEEAMVALSDGMKDTLIEEICVKKRADIVAVINSIN